MVYIDHRYKLIVIENPKSGSTTLLKCLEESLNIKISRKTSIKRIHLQSHEAREEYKDYWDTYLKVSTYRDPLERFISSALISGVIAKYDISHLEHGTPLDIVKLENFYKTNKDTYCYCVDQCMYTTGMDFLVRVSHFQEDYDKLSDMLKVPKIQVPHLNKNSIGINKIIDFKLLFNKIYFD